MIYGRFAEDIDYAVKGAGFTVDTGGGRFRSGYARCALGSGNSRSESIPFTPITSGWVTGRQYTVNGPTNYSKFFGLGKSGTLGGIFVGTSASAASKLALWRADAAGAYSEVQAEITSTSADGFQKLDMRIENFGVSTRVRIYVDGGANPVIDYTGDLTWTGATDLDIFVIGPLGGSSLYHRISEGIVADEDTRAMSLFSAAPNAAGDANTLDSGTYAEIDETSINDADLISSATASQAAQFGLTNMPAGVFTIKDVSLVYRGIRGSSGIQNWKCGVKTNGSIDVSQTTLMDTAWNSYMRSFGSVNPVTGVAWTQAEIDALQLAFESAA
jgi:hypothetical protein